MLRNYPFLPKTEKLVRRVPQWAGKVRQEKLKDKNKSLGKTGK